MYYGPVDYLNEIVGKQSNGDPRYDYGGDTYWEERAGDTYWHNLLDYGGGGAVANTTAAIQGGADIAEDGAIYPPSQPLPADNSYPAFTPPPMMGPWGRTPDVPEWGIPNPDGIYPKL